jgi:alkylation response protein AidB-like acyl-CoA dehydrogenase
MNDIERIRRVVDEFLADHRPGDTSDIEFRGHQFDAGLAFVAFDPGHGGLGLDPGMQSFVDRRLQQAGAPDVRMRNIIGLAMAAPTLHTHGSAEQRTLLRPLFTGEEIWCQLFSEPGAGSDLASLATRAEDRGDHYLLNGQKVWTSLGHVARRALLLARTDPGQPKHRGLSYFVLDMTAPGVQVRPLRQLTGESEFSEVYLTDVVMPKSALIGRPGDGWRIAMTTLMNERIAAGGGTAQRGEGPIAQAVAAYTAAAKERRADAADRDRLMMLGVRAEAARLTNRRATAKSAGSVVKLALAETNKAVYSFCLDMQGQEALLIDHYDDARPEFVNALGSQHPGKAYLRSLANSIEGGTSEVLRGVLGERVLGLVAEPKTDREVPWNRTRRS